MRGEGRSAARGCDVLMCLREQLLSTTVAVLARANFATSLTCVSRVSTLLQCVSHVVAMPSRSQNWNERGHPHSDERAPVADPGVCGFAAHRRDSSDKKSQIWRNHGDPRSFGKLGTETITLP